MAITLAVQSPTCTHSSRAMQRLQNKIRAGLHQMRLAAQREAARAAARQSQLPAMPLPTVARTPHCQW